MTHPITNMGTVIKARTEHSTAPWQGSASPGDIYSDGEGGHLGPGEGTGQGAQHLGGG